jgi:hypothetical protein
MTRSISVLIVTSLTAVGCSKSGPVGPTAAPGPGPAPKQTPVVSLQAAELLREVRQDGHATFTKYKDTTIEVDGVVADRGPYGSRNLPFLGLEGLGSKGSRRLETSLRCLFPASETDKILEFAPGQRVKVRGRLLSTLNEVVVGDCVIAEAGPSTAISVTAEELTREYAADRKATAMKYRNKVLFVTGTIVTVDDKDLGQQRLRLVLKGDAKSEDQPVNVDVEVRWDTKDEVTAAKAKPLRPGQTIRVSGPIGFLDGANHRMSNSVDILSPRS